MQGTMWLFPDSREWELGTREPRAGSREPEAGSRKLEAVSQEPEAGTGDSGIWESRIESR